MKKSKIKVSGLGLTYLGYTCLSVDLVASHLMVYENCRCIGL
jgi:hypothetical protein